MNRGQLPWQLDRTEDRLFHEGFRREGWFVEPMVKGKEGRIEQRRLLARESLTCWESGENVTKKRRVLSNPGIQNSPHFCEAGSEALFSMAEWCIVLKVRIVTTRLSVPAAASFSAGDQDLAEARFETFPLDVSTSYPEDAWDTLFVLQNWVIGPFSTGRGFGKLTGMQQRLPSCVPSSRGSQIRNQGQKGRLHPSAGIRRVLFVWKMTCGFCVCTGCFCFNISAPSVAPWTMVHYGKMHILYAGLMATVYGVTVYGLIVAFTQKCGQTKI